MKNETKDLDAALELKVVGDFEGYTIRKYLTELLVTLWSEGEGFSGKRPFGNSGWQWDVYVPLVRAGLISGEIDKQYDEVVDVDEATGADFVVKLIERAMQ